MATTTTAATTIENPKKTLGQPQPSGLNPTAQAEDPRIVLSTTITSPDTQQPQPPTPSSGGESKKVTSAKGASTAAADSSSNDDSGAVNSIQKKMKRAERFGVPVQLSEAEKRNSRAERFGTGPAVHGSDSKSLEQQRRKARAERFGLVQSESADEASKKKARLERFGAVTKLDSLEEEKKRARAIRFSQSQSTSVSHENGTPIELKPGVTGKAGGVA